jgi:hypothetical protein
LKRPPRTGTFAALSDHRPEHEASAGGCRPSSAGRRASFAGVSGAEGLVRGRRDNPAGPCRPQPNAGRSRPPGWPAHERIHHTEPMKRPAWSCYGQPSFQLPAGTIHAHRGKLLRDGHPVPADWDAVSTGPREIDLIPTLQAPRPGFRPTSATRGTVVAAYGQDIRSRDGYPVLRDIGNCSSSPVSWAAPPSASCTSGYSRSTLAAPGSEDRSEVHKRCCHAGSGHGD